MLFTQSSLLGLQTSLSHDFIAGEGGSSPRESESRQVVTMLVTCVLAYCKTKIRFNIIPLVFPLLLPQLLTLVNTNSPLRFLVCLGEDSTTDEILKQTLFRHIFECDFGQTQSHSIAPIAVASGLQKRSQILSMKTTCCRKFGYFHIGHKYFNSIDNSGVISITVWKSLTENAY